jgi:hypothetical protein
MAVMAPDYEQAQRDEARERQRLRNLAKGRRKRLQRLERERKARERKAAREAERKVVTLVREEERLAERYTKAWRDAIALPDAATQAQFDRAWDRVHKVGDGLRNIIAARRREEARRDG